MTDAAELERGYRRWLKWYPRRFRREHEAEILTVLMAGAQEGQRRPEPVECLDLVSSALRMHLRPTVPRSDRSVLAAIKFMYFGAAVELATAITIWTTIGEVQTGLIKSNPGLTESVVAGAIEPTEVAAILAIGFWLWMAWAVGRGHRWSRIVFALFLALNIYGLLNGLVHGSAVYARPDLTMGILLCLVELAAVAVLFRAKIAPYRSGASRITPG